MAHMRIDILTLFPAMVEEPLRASIIGRALGEGIAQLHVHDLRLFGKGAYRQVDDRPYGGGAGMVLMCEPVVRAIEHVCTLAQGKPERIYLSPRGEKLTQPRVERFARTPWLLLLCGHYEGIDHRIIDGGWIDRELSIGDYVLTGGELPAMVLVDAVVRQLPGALGDDASAEDESFSRSLGRKREYPHYTRPDTFRGMEVPSVLLSGDHAAIEQWRMSHLS